ncbi:MAG: transcription/translation regulatory transformer protein RfaH [Alcanivorax sp.]|nr:transcription/translation regulatory transformer protein RfaH [Alcanivorax sp.]
MQAGKAESRNQSAPAPSWYVIQCKPAQNERAYQNLTNQGYRCFSPQLVVEKVVAGRRVTRVEPLFPGYLFIQLQKGVEDWGAIRSTRGVLRLVRFGMNPVPVPGDVIQSLMRRSVDAGRPPAPAYVSGQAVRITHGPFADLHALFEGFRGEERAVVLLAMLEKHHRLTLNISELSPA